MEGRTCTARSCLPLHPGRFHPAHLENRVRIQSPEAEGDRMGLVCNLLISCSWLMASEANKGTLRGKQEMRAVGMSVVGSA